MFTDDPSRIPIGYKSRSVSFENPTGAPGKGGQTFGGRKGDRVEISIDGPAGFRFRKVLTLERKQAIFFRASGKKRPPGGWPEGRYDGRISLIRGDAVLSTKTSLNLSKKS